MLMTAEKAFECVSAQAEKIKTDADQRFPEAASFGDAWRQGDIIVTLVKKIPTEGYKLNKQPSAQLAPGETQGSRHILDSLEGVEVHERITTSALIGPTLVCHTKRTITHPEHGNITLPVGIYNITYQRNLDVEGREQRVAD